MSPSPRHTWPCPACGRQVPLRHRRCHCGQALTVRPPATRGLSDPPSVAPLTGLVLLLVLVIGASFYYGWAPPWSAGAAVRDRGRETSFPPLPEAALEDPSPFGQLPASSPGGSAASWPDGISPAGGASADASVSPGLVPPTEPNDEPILVRSREPTAATVGKPGPMATLERRAVAEITPRVEALAAMAGEAEARMREYVQACRPESVPRLPTTESGRAWLVPLLLDPAMAPASRTDPRQPDPTGCSALWDGVLGPADRAAVALRDLEAFVRRQGLLPGHLRAALEEHGLDGWERYRP